MYVYKRLRKFYSFIQFISFLYSMVQDMLLRYGYNNSLNFIFGKDGSIDQLKPLSKPFTLEYFKNINKHELPWHEILLEEEGYDVSTVYMKWNKTAIRYYIDSIPYRSLSKYKKCKEISHSLK